MMGITFYKTGSQPILHSCVSCCYHASHYTQQWLTFSALGEVTSACWKSSLLIQMTLLSMPIFAKSDFCAWMCVSLVNVHYVGVNVIMQ
jgi:hypothetical protein